MCNYSWKCKIVICVNVHTLQKYEIGQFKYYYYTVVIIVIVITITIILLLH